MNLFAIPISEMGLNPINIVILLIFRVFFIIAFGISSKNMDSAGIMKWMIKSLRIG
tara:strand:- start:643 stop:810 length:168 start_codon:yes stop_codon:yes gene_type:complete